MQYWMNKRFSRRVFLAVLFYLFVSQTRANYAASNTVKCDWCWLGGVTDRSITIKAKLSTKVSENKNYIQVFYHTSPDLSPTKPINKVRATSLGDRIATFNLNRLAADTTYYYVIIADGRRYPEKGTLRFKTVKVHQPYNFAIACSACAGGTIGQFFSSGVSNSRVFDVIRQYKIAEESNLALFIHMGDLHYRNDLPSIGLKEAYLDDYRHNYDLVLAQFRQRNLYQNIPLAYIWDDHDYGTNNSDGSYNLKYIASEVYRERVPAYSLVEQLDVFGGKGAIYQSFIVGRVRFIMTDSRFHQTVIENSPNNTLLGQEQKQWLFAQLQLGKQQQQQGKEGLIVWVNTIPWIVKEDSAINSWNQFTRERTEIADFIKENQIDKLLMISGDAHMLALDDGGKGTANSYGTGGGGSFPVIHAGSLDSLGSIKGGSYNGERYIVNSTVKQKNGAIPGKKQWGLLDFTDRGDRLEVKVRLKRMEDTLIQHTFVF